MCVLRSARGGRGEAGKPRLLDCAGRKREEVTMLGREKGNEGVVCGVRERRGRGRTSGTDIPKEMIYTHAFKFQQMNDDESQGNRGFTSLDTRKIMKL